jgi:hypothetical protein
VAAEKFDQVVLSELVRETDGREEPVPSEPSADVSKIGWQNVGKSIAVVDIE